MQLIHEHAFLRGFFVCSNCASIPRERALMSVINMYYPDYRNLDIHESSPSGRDTSEKLREECRHYTTSHYYPDMQQSAS